MRGDQITEPNRSTTLAGAFESMLAFWRVRANRRKQRRDLSRLDDHLLRDIGISRHDVAREARKSFWR